MDTGTSPITVYLAARLGRQREMRAIRDLLHATGRYLVISSWLDCAVAMDAHDTPPTLLRERAIQERDEVLKCQMLIHFNEPSDSPYGRGGRHTECGMAIGITACGYSEKTVVLIGYRENIFAYLPDVLYFPSLSAFLDAF